MPKLSIKDLDLKGKRVFIRVDFNVPVKDGKIGDDTRLRASLPTVRYALDAGATAVLASHLGRPKGKKNPQFSLRPIADRFGDLLGRPVAFVDECIGDEVKRAVDRVHAASSSGGGVLLLENLRFHAEEEKNDPQFAAALASLAGVYVNDAFGAAHRAHASVEGITHCLQPAAAGLLMERELRYLGHVLESPDRPFVAILGGAKVSDKIEVIENLLGKVDRLLIGGAMAYTFFKSRGVPIGRSLVEDDKLDAARSIESHATSRGVGLELPVDHVVADRVEAGAAHEVLAIGRCGDRRSLRRGHRTRDRAGIRETPRRRQNGRLERSDGRFRDRRVRGRHQRRRAGGGRTSRARRSSAAAIRSPPSGRPGWPTGSRTFRPAAAPRSNSSEAVHYRESRHSATSSVRLLAGGRDIMRIPFIAGNWKMFKTVQEAVVFVKELRPVVKDVTDVEIVVAPPFTAVHAVADAARNTNIGVAAQDVYWERDGAFTGEVSPGMIKEAGAAYVIVGHSERRRLFGETDQIVSRKAMAAIAGGLTPIVCIGETLEERERGETLAVLDRQIKEGLTPTHGGAGWRPRQSRQSHSGVRAGLGHRHRPQRDGRAGGRSARAHSRAARGVVRRRSRRALPCDLRRERETG